MQNRNNYSKEVFNGMTGKVTWIDMEDRELFVDFDGTEVCYDAAELNELILAYAATIHKSQGSEYPVVIMPVSAQHQFMLNRHLIYTGVTRAKKICVLIGSPEELRKAIGKTESDKRNTLLKYRLRQYLPEIREKEEEE